MPERSRRPRHNIPSGRRKLGQTALRGCFCVFSTCSPAVAASVLCPRPLSLSLSLSLSLTSLNGLIC